MPSKFDQQFDAFSATTHDDEFGITVKFGRGNNTSAAFTCSFSDVDEELITDDTFAHRYQRRLWYPLATQLVINGSTITPRSGDYILDTATGDRFDILADDDLPGAAKHPGGLRYTLRTTRG